MPTGIAVEPIETGSWNTWDGLADGNSARVRSMRLSRRSNVQSRSFPKIRSWFALGAPLELLSPLSVLRVLFGAGLVSASAFTSVSIATHDGWVLQTVSLVAFAFVSLGLSFIRSVATVGSERLTAVAVVAGAAIEVGHGGAIAAAWCGLWLVLVALFAGMFVRPRAIVTMQLAILIGGAATYARVMGWMQAVGVGAIVSLVYGVVAVTVWFLVLSARRRGEVDPDTGLPNGFGLARHFGGSGERSETTVAVVLLDGLNNVREAMGYQVGIELLRRVVEDLGQVVPADARIGRVGGDELVVVRSSRSPEQVAATGVGLVNVPADVLASARELAAALRPAVRAGRYLVAGIELSVRPHIGLAVAPWHGASLIDVVRCASLSASRAMHTGADDVMWDGDGGELTSDDLALLADLRLAADRNELRLAYQPQVAARSGRTVSVEALLRWRSPVHGDVSPGRFIPLAERTGLIDRLTDWVLCEALDAQTRWRGAGWHIPVAVNISAKTLHRPDLPEWVMHELAARHLPPTVLVLELTETAPTTDLLHAIAMFRPLHEKGVRISIDDFGTGYTSLAALPALPVDELKIDQSFVRRSVTSPGDHAVVRTVAELAHRLGMVVVAEGVEDDAIRRRMLGCKVDLLQGYHFARPLTESEVLVHFEDRAQRADLTLTASV